MTSGTTTQPSPNVIVILADDLGYSDIGCYGGEINTPNLDRLAIGGVRATSFYNTARCSPSRASLLTGRHPHETGIGILTDDLGPYGGYPGSLSPRFKTLAEHLKSAGYSTCLSGKWHLSSNTKEVNETWPTRRGFDEFFGIMPGADSYFYPRNLWHNETLLEQPVEDFYLTDAVTDHAVDFIRQSAGSPFFLYLAYTAPHWPLHAKEEDIARYDGVYDKGWDEIRRERFDRMQSTGIAGAETSLSERDPSQPAWDEVSDKDWEARRMAIYAAQIDCMDQGIGRVIKTLEELGEADNTMVIFLSDNGASSEPLPPAGAPHFLQRQPTHTPSGRPLEIGNEPTIVPGDGMTYSSYGRAWANASNTPFRYYKRWVHEGGVATPFLVSWPQGGLSEGAILREAFQLTDLLPTILDAAHLRADPGFPGISMLPSLQDRRVDATHPLFWEHVGNAAVRHGQWKLVRIADQPWELYNVTEDRSELVDLSTRQPEVVQRLAELWNDWAESVGVIPWDRMRETVSTHGG